MIEDVDKKHNIKTYVKGTYLFSDDGLEYKEKNNDGKAEEKVVEDRIGFLSLQQQIEKQKTSRVEKEKFNKKRNNPVVDRPTLIPIKDTPVQPVPEPIQEYQKCEMATQEQFEYFQTYISIREREKQLEEVQQKEIQRFLDQKQKRATLQPQPSPVSLVFAKEDKPPNQKQKSRRIIKRIIKKKDQQREPHELPQKVRVVCAQDAKQWSQHYQNHLND